jgi:uncharacterized membrane protein
VKDVVVMISVSVALVLVLVIGSLHASDSKWPDGATIMLPANGRGVVVAQILKSDSTITIIDSINIVASYDGETYLTRAGNPFGKFPSESWTVFVGIVGYVGGGMAR